MTSKGNYVTVLGIGILIMVMSPIIGALMLDNGSEKIEAMVMTLIPMLFGVSMILFVMFRDPDLNKKENGNVT